MIPNTFWLDFTIADTFGAHAINDTYKRAFAEWKDDYKMLTALVITLNHKIWQHYENKNNELSQLYDKLWKQADTFAYNTLKGEALEYFIETTD